MKTATQIKDKYTVSSEHSIILAIEFGIGIVIGIVMNSVIYHSRLRTYAPMMMVSGFYVSGVAVTPALEKFARENKIYGFIHLHLAWMFRGGIVGGVGAMVIRYFL